MKYMPQEAIAQAPRIRSKGWSMVSLRSTMAAATATVAPMTMTMPDNLVSTVFSCAVKNTRISDSARKGTCSAMEMTTTRALLIRKRQTASPRAGKGANSREMKVRSCMLRPSDRSKARAVMIKGSVASGGQAGRHDRHGRRTDPENRGVRLFHEDAHREALGDAHPVDGTWYARQPPDVAAAVVGEHAIADRFHDAREALVRIAQHIDLRPLPRLDVSQFGLAEIGHHVPAAGIGQREDRMAGGGKLADRGLEVDPGAVERRPYGGVFQIEPGQFDLRLDHLALGDQRIDPADAGRCLLGFEQGRAQLGLRAALGRARLVDLLGRDEFLAEQRLQAGQGVGGLFGRRAGPLHAGAGGGSPKLLCIDRALRQVDLVVERFQVRLGFGQGGLIRTRIDAEEHIALLHRLVVLDGQLDNAPVR